MTRVRKAQVDRTVCAWPSAARSKRISNERPGWTNQGEVRDARKIELHLEHDSPSTSNAVKGLVDLSFVAEVLYS